MKQCPTSSTLKMEATNFSVSSTNLYQTSRHHVSVIYDLFSFEFFEKNIFFLRFLALRFVKKASCTLYFVLIMQNKL